MIFVNEMVEVTDCRNSEGRDLELGGAKVGFEKERCPLCMEDDGDKHPNLMFKYLEIKKWREYFVGKIGSAFSAC
jgi:hypothetical protein